MKILKIIQLCMLTIFAMASSNLIAQHDHGAHGTNSGTQDRTMAMQMQQMQDMISRMDGISERINNMMQGIGDMHSHQNMQMNSAGEQHENMQMNQDMHNRMSEHMSPMMESMQQMSDGMKQMSEHMKQMMGDTNLMNNEKFRDKMEDLMDNVEDLIDNYEELIENVNETQQVRQD